MLYRPLPTAGVLQNNLLFIEFHTKTWNCPVESFYIFPLRCISKSQTKAGVPCEAPGIPLQPEEAAKRYKANFSPPRIVSYLRAGRNYETKHVLAPQDVYSQLTGQRFVLFLLPSLTCMGGWEGLASKISWELPSLLSRRATSKEPAATEKRNPTTAKWTKSHPYKLMEEIAIKSY